MPEDWKILCSKHRKKRQRKKQREREREREREKTTNERMRTNLIHTVQCSAYDMSYAPAG